MQPAVSVVIPCFNAERWIGETLQSALAAASALAEIIVVDDGSTDRSAEMVAGFPVRLLRVANGGVSRARNLGLEASQADHVVFLDADDLLVPGCLDTQLEIAHQSAAEMVYGDWQRLQADADGEWQRGSVMETPLDDDPAAAILRGIWRPSGAYLFRRDLATAVGGFEPSQSVLADCRFYFECAVRARAFAHNRTVCCQYRVHASGQSMASRSQRLFFEENLRNAQQARHWWESHATFDGPRKDAYLRVLDYLARSTALHHPDLFAAACSSFEELSGRTMPFGLKVTRWAVLVLGYRRYRRLQSFLGKSLHHPAAWVKKGSGTLSRRVLFASPSRARSAAE
jgi:glycosyltransferase involved in cell wall biosynthesis